jgi:5-methylcytosine-specific restriction protein B
MEPFGKDDRDLIINGLEAALDQSLERQGFRTLFEDEDGRGYLILGNTAEGDTKRSNSVKPSQCDELLAHPKPGLFVVGLKSDDQIDVFAQALGPLLGVLDGQHNGRVRLTFEREGEAVGLDEADKDYQLRRVFSIRRGGENGDEPAVEMGAVEATDLFQEERGPFSRETFQLLEGLHQTPRKSYYEENKGAIDEHLRQPFQAFFKSVADELPPAITNRLETEKYLFGRILKNDFGQGGAWDYYWGAFYPKGESRTESAQLFFWMNREHVRFGFGIGEHSGEQSRRFLQNVERLRDRLDSVLAESVEDGNLLFGHRDEEVDIQPDGSVHVEGREDFSEWLDHVQDANIRACAVLSKQEFLSVSSEELRSRVALVFRRVFPLMLLAMREDPLPVITEYLEQPVRREEDEPNPPYELEVIEYETGIDASMLQQWRAALRRKRQAIFYGPPGTGKTFLAQKLAKHLIGGGYGFADLVQFHPSYAYEDFMQGLRPTKDDNRNLSYEMEAGHFLTFCDRAENRTDPCVLIIDEINRANLSRVFGELMYLLEYRDESVELAGGTTFHIPENVYLIGTMNTADRSIALVDHALRRRFAFLPLFPRMKVLRRFHERNGTDFNVEPLVELLEEVNRAIDDRHYHVGPSYFLREEFADELDAIWRYEIVPYLEEYFFGEPGSVEPFRWANVRDRFDLTA